MSGPARTHWPSRRVLAGDRAWSFDLDCRTGGVVVALDDGPVRLRSLRWSEKVTLARFAVLGSDLVDEQLLRLAVEGDAVPPAGDARHALLALVSWLEAPSDDALALRPELMAAVTLDVCGAMGINPSELDDRDAAEVAALWRASDGPARERHAGARGDRAGGFEGLADDGGEWTRIEFVPDPSPPADEPAGSAPDLGDRSPPAPTAAPTPGEVAEAPAATDREPSPATPRTSAGAARRDARLADPDARRRMAFVPDLRTGRGVRVPASRTAAGAEPFTVPAPVVEPAAAVAGEGSASARDGATPTHDGATARRGGGAPGRRDGVAAKRGGVTASAPRAPAGANPVRWIVASQTPAGRPYPSAERPAARGDSASAVRDEADSRARAEHAAGVAMSPRLRGVRMPPAPAATVEGVSSAASVQLDVDDLLDELGERLATAAAELGIAER